MCIIMIEQQTKADFVFSKIDAKSCPVDQWPDIYKKIIGLVKELALQRDQIERELTRDFFTPFSQQPKDYLIESLLVFVKKTVKHFKKDGDSKIWDPLLDKKTVQSFLQLIETLGEATKNHKYEFNSKELTVSFTLKLFILVN